MSSSNTTEANFGPLVAGLLTTAIDTVSPGTVAKVQAVTSHDIGSFLEHNLALEPLISDGISVLEGLAASHGLAAVNSVVNAVLGILTSPPAGSTVSVPAAHS